MPKMKSRRRAEGYVYVISAENSFVKIGSGSNPFERYSSVRGLSPVPVVLSYICKCADPVGVEDTVHQALATRRKHGEWFDLTADVAIAALRAELEARGGVISSAPHRSANIGAPPIHRAAISETASIGAPSTIAAPGVLIAHPAASLSPNS